MIIKTPDWVKNAVFYQIFPDRFAKGKNNTSKQKFNPILQPWQAKPTLDGYKGGDLWGVIERLDYLQDLGINALYFTPIFQSASNHRYHPHDYYKIDPMLGGNEAFTALREATRDRNIKIVLDGVFNHASRGFFFFNDILEHGDKSPWLDWFKVEGWPLSAYDGSKPANYKSWVDNRSLPQFNHDNPDVREYIMQVGEYWLQQGIDGWRLDVPAEVETPGFWQEFRDRVKAINPEAYIVGEVWIDARKWLDGTQFDAVMNYLFAVPTIAFTAGDRVDKELLNNSEYYPTPAIDAAEYAHKIQELFALYDWEIHLAQLNLLDSHDTARLLSIAGEDIDSLKLATLLLFTFPGAPCIFYGDEIGLTGGIDPDNRWGFPEEKDWHQDLLKFHKELIALRHQYPALRTGNYETILAEKMVYGFKRTGEDSELLVLVNSGSESASVNLEVEKTNYQLIYGDAKIIRGENNTLTLTLNLPSRQGCILG
ncbi:glycoside hydrolase family 13 protein [Spirulina sp. 06S082]|uniref:glycoside hydrolase family 13 protein n=1 Tax=Spirulina sp. 06S082 TaxID=3110248 RepID=UPI002B1FBC3F|nr:glycoside hydrolase family 13 protein [Spirulina sp. 06S082]MEA5470518.1 glycoside hydrolase family 13 protein [Spirulina sp. 06S082]